ncbi:uncharacterized protein A4U43_C07F13670 [Asparagus officinalis]|uniref:Uncharacterized protein n=1 Tax=Asparagus officinalis TaxID=4686 RepID=A0A5P1EBR6_ASPOF|nr:uncharacterized protein A4U43_C07F13670 [Asparagus officinalis]
MNVLPDTIGNMRGASDEYELMLDRLQPPDSLRGLTIEGYQGARTEGAAPSAPRSPKIGAGRRGVV